ncbi:MAG: hypothetical protein AAFX40_14575, partial [Cyanobacteria bacterium J06639_1]
ENGLFWKLIVYMLIGYSVGVCTGLLTSDDLHLLARRNLQTLPHSTILVEIELSTLILGYLGGLAGVFMAFFPTQNVLSRIALGISIVILTVTISCGTFLILENGFY